MTALVQYSAVERVNRYLDRMDQQKSPDTFFILEYDKKIQDLRVWLWPIDGITKKRLVPDEFKKHQETHHFHAPSCFCVILDEQEERMEAVFLVDPEHGWMIRCAKNKCGYAVFNIEIASKNAHLPTKQYRRREDENCKLCKKTEVSIVGAILDSIQTSDPPKKPATIDLLRQLDEIFTPGLPEDVFISLFLQCRVCRYIMTKRVFNYHLCLGVKPPAKHSIIDLTLDESGLETEEDK